LCGKCYYHLKFIYINIYYIIKDGLEQRFENYYLIFTYFTTLKVGVPQTFDALEASLLNGQKLQGVMTSDEIQEILRMKGWEQVRTE
jgi:hypothetical protein